MCCVIETWIMETITGRWFHRLLKIGNSRSEFRTIFVGNKLPSNFASAAGDLQQFPSNRITSSRYTAWNFIPKNLFEQFHRVANLYFLVMAIIELTIDSPVAPVTSVIPLSIVVGTTAIKQIKLYASVCIQSCYAIPEVRGSTPWERRRASSIGYEDWLRHKADREVNDCEALVIRDGQVVNVKSEDLHVGDVIKVIINDVIPCDMVLLSSASDDGRCHITSANLDGETNLKIFSSVQLTKNLMTESDLGSLRGSIDCQQPVTDLYQFIGRINIFRDSDDVVTVPLGPENVLLRGVRLKNTDFVYGCAIYTGQETKISLNSRSTYRKSSQVERKMNRLLLVMLLVLVIYAFVWVAMTMSFYFRPHHESLNMWYLSFPLNRFRKSAGKDQASAVVQLVLGFMVLCKAVIPISMYVSIEMQKFIGSKFFDWDLQMYNPTTDEPAKARTSDLNEELGQVEYLFADKTGTLTRNDMRFRMCSCGGNIYEELNGELVDTFRSSVICRAEEVMALLVSIALCHTVQVHSTHSLDGASLEYYCSSPDEKALIEACSRLGVTFAGCQGDQLELILRSGECLSFVRRQVLAFDSTRKRMSVIIEDKANGNIWLICKGAEVAIFERTVDGDVAALEKHINKFAELGLRTLVIARRQLTRDEYDNVNDLLQMTRNKLADRELQLAEVYSLIEKDLCLVGATAVEDQLQDGVADTLQSLRQAGIQIWVLTGDRLETAVNVSYSSGHFIQGSSVLSIVQQATSENCGDALKQIDMRLDEVSLIKNNDEFRQHNLVIDGSSLSFALTDHRKLLRSVCMRCAAVMCCRLSPIQKAQVVRLMKEASSRPTTAAIGDGANDVSMIREAHVGLAVYGKEGRNAVRASDYAFSQFSYLKRVLLVHGYHFYIRLSVLVQYFFYKNIAIVLSQLLYNFFNGFSAQSLYDNYYLTMYNTLFSSLPILVFGLLEQTVTARHLLGNPNCYRNLKRNRLMSNSNFLLWSSLGIWHALVMYFGVYLANSEGTSLFANGKGIGVYDFGAVIMTTCVITINIKLMLVTHNFNILLVGSFVLTFGAYFIVSLVYNVILWRMWSPHLYQTLTTLLAAPSVWLLIILLVVTSLIPDVILRTIVDTYSSEHHRRRTVSKVEKSVNSVSTVSFTRRNESISISQANLVIQENDDPITA